MHSPEQTEAFSQGDRLNVKEGNFIQMLLMQSSANPEAWVAQFSESFRDHVEQNPSLRSLIRQALAAKGEEQLHLVEQIQGILEA